MSKESEYILGVNQTELERLEFQNSVWENCTNDFLNKINIKKGSKCLDAGAGPGFVSVNLLDRVGDEGEVTALEPSEFYLNFFRDHCKKNNLKNVNVKFVGTQLPVTLTIDGEVLAAPAAKAKAK